MDGFGKADIIIYTMSGAVVGPVIVGYHGCDMDVGARVVQRQIVDLSPRRNPYDWLGDGIYFFESDLIRAQQFAAASSRDPGKRLTARPIRTPYAIGAVICMGRCLDLSRQSGIDEVVEAYGDLERGKGPDQELPRNRCAGADDTEGILHNLDRAVINFIHGRRVRNGVAPYDTVRGLFRQGAPAFPTSAISKLSHVQIAVRNVSCIIGYFHPPPPISDPFQGLNTTRPLPYKKIKRP